MKLLTTARNAPEALVICSRLRNAGIEALDKGNTLGPYLGDLGSRDIYVEDHDFDRAREVLNSNEDFSEDELARAEEQDAAERSRRQQ